MEAESTAATETENIPVHGFDGHDGTTRPKLGVSLIFLGGYFALAMSGCSNMP
jgi:hypothetical protein